MKLEVRTAELTDAIPFLKLEAKCFGMRFTQESYYYWRPVLDYCWAFKAMIGENLVGGVIAMPTRDGFIYINSLFVHPRERRKGIATELLRRVLSIKTDKGFILDIKADKTFLRKFYENYGFCIQKIEPNYYLDSSQRIIMVLEPSRF